MEAGNKVKFTVRFRGREITHPEKAQEQLDHVVKQCEDLSNVEVRPMMEGRTMTLLIAPKPAVMQRVSQMKAAAEKARQQAIKEGRALPPEPEEEPDLDDDDDDEDDEDDEDAEHDHPAT